MDMVLQFNDLAGRPVSVNARYLSAITPGEGFDGSCVYLVGVESPLVSSEPADSIISRWCGCLARIGCSH